MMKSGLKAPGVFDRDDIVSERGLRQAAERLNYSTETEATYAEAGSG
jgi:hypothetical protein